MWSAVQADAVIGVARRDTGMRVAERLKKAIEVDPTRAVVDYNKILREEKNEEEPQQYSRHAGRQRRISELERARRPNR
jgi:hypothetical protein